jgi:hypothetical protein
VGAWHFGALVLGCVIEDDATEAEWSASTCVYVCGGRVTICN